MNKILFLYFIIKFLNLFSSQLNSDLENNLNVIESIQKIDNNKNYFSKKNEYINNVKNLIKNNEISFQEKTHIVFNFINNIKDNIKKKLNNNNNNINKDNLLKIKNIQFNKNIFNDDINEDIKIEKIKSFNYPIIFFKSIKKKEFTSLSDTECKKKFISENNTDFNILRSGKNKKIISKKKKSYFIDSDNEKNKPNIIHKSKSNLKKIDNELVKNHLSKIDLYKESIANSLKNNHNNSSDNDYNDNESNNSENNKSNVEMIIESLQDQMEVWNNLFANGLKSQIQKISDHTKNLDEHKEEFNKYKDESKKSNNIQKILSGIAAGVSFIFGLYQTIHQLTK